MDSAPRFRVDKSTSPPRVFLQCSNCHKDIREVKKHENIRVTRGYYCKACDDGTIHLNTPNPKENDDGNR